MNVTLDITAALGAIIWPLVVLIILLAYRKKIPTLVEGLTSRVTKLGFGGFSLELAVVKPFVPEFSVPGTFDLRHQGTAVQINDSTAGTFIEQLRDEVDAEYAEINLGAGRDWLTSRLFIMAIVFARMKGIKCFVFVEPLPGGSTRHVCYLCWAEPEKIRWALAKHLSEATTGPIR